MKIRENVPIAELTTMCLGGTARYVIEITNPQEVVEAYQFAAKQDLPTFVLGKGANTIGRDEGYNGVILVNQLRGIEILEEQNDTVILKGMGGELWDDFVQFTVKKGYSGIEAMAAIPGTLGAAPVQNIGAYGQDMAQVIESVEVYNVDQGAIETIPRIKIEMQYRASIFNRPENKGKYFIISVTVKLRKNELKPPFYDSLQHYIEEHGETDFSPANIAKMVRAIRAAKLPDPTVEASSGSFFKNVLLTDTEADAAEARGIPVRRSTSGLNKVNSGWLIEQCDLKGRTLHGMRINDKATLVLINDSAKSYADLAAARAEIQAQVKAKFGYDLEQEPVELV